MQDFFDRIHNIGTLLKAGFTTENLAENMILQAMYDHFGNDKLMWALTYFQKLERDTQKKEISKYRTSLQFSAGLFKNKKPTTWEILFYLKGAFPEGTCKGYSQQENAVFNALLSKLDLSQVDSRWLETYEMTEYVETLLKQNTYAN